jgi:NAD(P)-dependent dehydrogenase (short-subunit alcohol dehydrogenase family)
MSVVVMVTGASRGIGLGIVHRLLADRNVEYQVIAVSTSRIPEEHPRLTSIVQSVLEFNRDIEQEVDVLINNAGIASSGHPGDSISECGLDELTKCFQVNVVGTLNMIRRVKLRKGAKIVNISSSLGSIADVHCGNTAPYRISKAALNMLTKCCAAEYKDFTCVAVSPGWVKTDMGKAGNRSPDLEIEECVEKLVPLIQSLQFKDSGRFIDLCGNDVNW